MAKKTVAKKATPKKAAAKKTAAKKTAAKKTVAKKAVPTKTGAKKVVPKKAAVAKKAATKGAITSWNPATGRGIVTTEEGGEVPFDLMETEFDNTGYVDLHVGRSVEVSSGDDEKRYLTAT